MCVKSRVCAVHDNYLCWLEQYKYSQNTIKLQLSYEENKDEAKVIAHAKRK